MADSPQYTATPISKSVKISTANSNLDGTGTRGLLYTSVNGSLIESFVIKAEQATTSGMIRIFKNANLLFEIYVDASTSPTFETVKNLNEYSLYLEAGDEIYVSTQNSESFSVTVLGGEF